MGEVVRYRSIKTAITKSIIAPCNVCTFLIALIVFNRAVALHSRNAAQKWFSWKYTSIMEAIILILICSILALPMLGSYGKYEVDKSTFRLEIG